MMMSSESLTPESGEPGEDVSHLGFAASVAGVLVSPRKTFRHLCSEAPRNPERLAEAIFLVALVSAVDGLRLVSSSLNPVVLAVTMLLSILSGFMLWLSLIAVPYIGSYCLKVNRDACRALAVGTAWASLPWLIMAPVSLYRPATGDPAIWLMGAVLFAWMVFLFWLVVEEAFKLSAEQVLYVVVIIPQLVIIAATLWLGQILSEAVSLLFP